LRHGNKRTNKFHLPCHFNEEFYNDIEVFQGEKKSISIACESDTLAHLIRYLKNSKLFGWDDMAHWD
jgi:hypothetical protein